jgi:hypothetical protein
MTEKKIRELLQNQINQEKASMLYFVLKRPTHECLERYEHKDLEKAVALLKTCKYLDTKFNIARFEVK